jgi:ABC-type glycerol-3-phosphate transport system permease component
MGLAAHRRVYVIVVTPGIIPFAFAQRLFFKGLMEGVLKA